MQKELAYWVPKFIDKLRTLPELRDVASDQLNSGLLADLTIDRDTASRLGILPATIDNTLYDAYGQRQVSTMFTQLNQYHVVLEVNPQFQTGSRAAQKYLREVIDRPAGTAQRIYAFRAGCRLACDQSPGTISGCHALVQPRAWRFTRRRGQRNQSGER